MYTLPKLRVLSYAWTKCCNIRFWKMVTHVNGSSQSCYYGTALLSAVEVDKSCNHAKFRDPKGGFLLSFWVIAVVFTKGWNPEHIKQYVKAAKPAQQWTFAIDVQTKAALTEHIENLFFVCCRWTWSLHDYTQGDISVKGLVFTYRPFICGLC